MQYHWTHLQTAGPASVYPVWGRDWATLLGLLTGPMSCGPICLRSSKQNRPDTKHLGTGSVWYPKILGLASNAHELGAAACHPGPDPCSPLWLPGPGRHCGRHPVRGRGLRCGHPGWARGVYVPLRRGLCKQRHKRLPAPVCGRRGRPGGCRHVRPGVARVLGTWASPPPAWFLVFRCVCQCGGG
jgi:hypothetical protein